MRPGCGFEPYAHRCAIRTPEERFRPCLAGSHGPLPSSATIGGREPSAPIPVDQRQPFTIEQERNPAGDMLSPKIGVTVIVYSPSDGNTWSTSIPPRVPNGRPSM
jgi:hypothetical protein